MKNNKLFQYVVIGLFVFLAIVGAIMFSTYRNKDKANENISITLWGTLSSDSFTSFFSRYFSEVGLKYNINYVERSSATFDRDLVEAIASGTGPDAVILPEELILRYKDKILPIPFSSLSETDFKDFFIEEGELFLTSAGALAVPFSVDPLIMYWNRDIFNNVSITKPPADWTEVSALVSKIVQKDSTQNILRSAVALGEMRNVVNAKEILSALLIQSGSQIVKENSDGTYSSALKDTFGLNTAPAVLALEFYTNFSNPVRREYSWNRSLPNSLDAFADGDLAIYFGLASEFLKIKDKNPNLNFDVAILPQVAKAKTFSTFGNLQGFALLKSSKNPGGAFVIISALSSAQAFPFWKDIFNIPSARRDILAQPEEKAVKSIFNKSAIMSKGWLDPDYVESNKIFQEMVESYTTGRESLEASISTASDRLDSLLSNR